MRAQAVPDENQGAGKMSAKVLERLDNIGAAYRMVKMTLEQAAFCCQSHHRREDTTLADAPQHRRVASGSPGRGEFVQKGEADFIHKGDLGADLRGFFLFAASRLGARLR